MDIIRKIKILNSLREINSKLKILSSKMDNIKTIAILNSLREINNLRIEGYTSASNETEEEELVNLFREFASSSKKYNDELETEIKYSGGVPVDDTITAGKYFRVRIDLKTALIEKDRKEILNSIEYGEDNSIATYKKVMQNDHVNLNQGQLSLIKEQSASFVSDLKKIISMRGELVETM